MCRVVELSYEYDGIFRGGFYRWLLVLYCIRSRTHVLSRVSGGPVDTGLAPSRPPAARCPSRLGVASSACRLSRGQTRAQQSKSQIVKSCNGTRDTGESNQPPAPPEVMRLGGQARVKPSSTGSKLPNAGGGGNFVIPSVFVPTLSVFVPACRWPCRCGRSREDTMRAIFTQFEDTFHAPL